LYAARRPKGDESLSRKRPRFRCLVVAGFVLAPAAAHAHPHEWVDIAAEVLFDEEGRIDAIRHHWRFDEAFTAFALQGLDANGDDEYSEAELDPLAQENVEALKDFGYFTFVSVGDDTAALANPTEYRLDFDGERLTLHYTLPLAEPLPPERQVLVQVYDPEYYIAFALPSAEAVRLVDAPAGCRLAVYPAAGPDADAAAALATIGADQRELPPEMQDLATGIDNSAEIDCGGPTVARSEPATDLRALPPAPSAQAAPTPPRREEPGPYARFVAWIAGLQAAFNLQLTASLKALTSGSGAFWWLGGVSFLYGIAHAAGPGHGKVVISSYLVASEQRIRRGVLIAFLAAFVQALVAVAIIGAMAAILDTTSAAITDTAKVFEAGSFALVALLGLHLLVRKGRQAWKTFRSYDALAHQHHAESPSTLQGEACCHQHHAPVAIEKPGIAGAAAAVLSVGIRPCSGALVVLVFALAQGVFWAGVVSTFLMALGTAITVAALAALTVGAKDVARRLAEGDGRRAGQVMLALEGLAALFITLLGAALFAGSLSA
jgi:ABC-type nickel/cobalt efflux system permease component RcnA/ABC-type uncharacterized transport system substrate-binding protein